MDSLRPFLNLAPRRKASIGLTLLLLTGLVLSACGAHKSEVNKKFLLFHLLRSDTVCYA